MDIKKYYPMALLGLITLKMLIPGSDWSVSLFGLGLVALFGYNQFLDSKKSKPLDQTVNERLDSMQNQISNMSVKTGLRPQPKDGQKWF